MIDRSSAQRWLPLSLAVALATAGAPNVASAHPRLMRSMPSASARVDATAVRMLSLWFNERPELRLTSLTLSDSAGRVVELAAIEPEPNDPFGVRARVVGSLAPGTYTVSWRTAASDGHPVKGSFAFVVTADTAARSPAPAAGPAMQDSVITHREGSSVTGIAYTTVRALGFVALLILLGTVAFRFAALPLARAQSVLDHEIQRRAARVGTLAASALAVVAVARLALQIRVLEADLTMGNQALSAGDVLATRWGMAWLIQVAATIVALSGLAIARRSRLGWGVALLAAVVLSLTPGLAGHAAATARLTSVAIVSDAIHVAAASGWLGGLFVLMTVAIPSAVSLSSDAERWAAVTALVNGFSPVALAFAALLAVSGVVTAWLHIGSPGALWSSGYGRTLLLKLGALVPLLATGAYNWRVVRPTLGSQRATSRLKQAATVELLVGVTVIAITSVLVAMEPPVQ